MLRRLVGLAGTGHPQWNAWDPTHKGDHFTLTNQNRTAANDIPTVTTGTVLSVYGKSSGVYQCEHTIDVQPVTGIIETGVAYQTVDLNAGMGAVENMWTWIITSAGIKSNNTGQTPWETGTLIVTDVLGLLLDIAGNSLKYYKNGTLLSWDPFGWPGGPFSNIMRTSKDEPQYGPFAGTVYWAFRSIGATGGQITSNFGHTAFAFPIAGASPMHGPST